MHRDVVVIGGSAGALDPLKQIAADLQPDLPAAVVVCLHMAATARSALAPILNRAGGMRVVTPRSGDPLHSGYLYVPSPDHHLELRPDGIHLTTRPKVNGVRPAIDVLFRSAANVYRERVIGVVLSGGLDDGSAGLAAIRAAGGIGIVQAPDESFLDSMPKNAIALAEPEHVLPAGEIGLAIARLVKDHEVKRLTVRSQGGVTMEAVGASDTPGEVTGVTCPDCHGSIWLQAGAGGEVAFTCRVGHSYSPESFFEIQAENVENVLWAGVRSLEEQAAFAEAMATRSERIGDPQAAERHRKRRAIADASADAMRKLILNRSEEVA